MSAVLTPPRAGPPRFAALKRFTVAEYHRWIDAGHLTPADRVELRNGFLVQTMPQNKAHADAVFALQDLLPRLLPAGYLARSQLPLTLAESEPEPDAAIVKGSRKVGFARHPLAADAAVVIEVADTSLDDDRTDKLELYARAGVPEYWIVNLVDAWVEVYTLPQPDGTYAHRQDYPAGAAVPVILDGVKVFELPVDELF